MAAALGWGGGTQHSHTVCHQCWCCAHTAVSHSHTAPSPPPCRARWPRGTSVPGATSIPCRAHMATCHLPALCHCHVLIVPPWPRATSIPCRAPMATYHIHARCHHHLLAMPTWPCGTSMPGAIAISLPCLVAMCHIPARCHLHSLLCPHGHMSHPCPVPPPFLAVSPWPRVTSTLCATSIPCHAWWPRGIRGGRDDGGQG